MIADRVRMRKVKNREMGGVEVTIHTLNFEFVDIYVGDGTLDAFGNPEIVWGDHYTLVHTINGNGTITLIVEEGSYITIDYRSIYDYSWSLYYTSLDSFHRSLDYTPTGGNIHITENIEIYYESEDDD